MNLPIKDWQKTSLIDYPPYTASVIFCGGCNFRCSFCHNPELVLEPHKSKNIEVDKILKHLESKKKWIDAVCITGGEPTLYPDLYKLAYELKKQGFFEKLDTNGTNPEFLKYLIENKLIDGAVVSRTEAPFSREATFADSKYDLLKASGVKLDITPQLDEIQKFCTYTHSIPKLNHYKFKKLAVVGTPCQIYTIACMKDLGVTPSQNVEICLGLFCYENFFFERSQIEKFEKDFNIRFSDIKKINIKEDVIFTLKDQGTGEKIIHIPFNHLEGYMRAACNACADFTNIYSDISFGGLGSPEKYTTVIPRTEKGEEIFKRALNAGVIKQLDISDDKKQEMVNLITQFSKSKVNRKEQFMKNLS